LPQIAPLIDGLGVIAEAQGHVGLAEMLLIDLEHFGNLSDGDKPGAVGASTPVCAGSADSGSPRVVSSL
jgi:hypothetical protein